MNQLDYIPALEAACGETGYVLLSREEGLWVASLLDDDMETIRGEPGGDFPSALANLESALPEPESEIT